MVLRIVNFKYLPVLLFTLLIFIDASALLLEKMASNIAIQDSGHFYNTLVQQPCMWIGVGVGPIQLMLWTRILSRMDLSVAYPSCSLCYPITMLASQFILHENLTSQVWLGAILITFGVSLLSQQPSGGKASCPNLSNIN